MSPNPNGRLRLRKQLESLPRYPPEAISGRCSWFLCLALLLFPFSPGWCQGMVNFFNAPSTLISAINGAPITGAAGSYYFALLTAPVGTTNLGSFNFTGSYATNVSGAAGRINGGRGAVVTGWPSGVKQAFVVCGWPASDGHDWNPKWLAPGPPPNQFGMSAIATGAAGGPSGYGFPTPSLNLFGSPVIASGFTISCAEPYWNGFSVLPANQAVNIGASAMFDVQANACPTPLYQWYLNGTPISAATDNTYQISNAQPADAGTYTVMLSNSAWPVCCQTQSVSATLTVLSTPVIDSQPQSQTVAVGSTVVLQVLAQGPAPLGFQWFFNNAKEAADNQQTLWLTNVQLSDSGVYTVVVSNLYGSVTSSPAVLRIGKAPSVTTPMSVAAEVGSSARFNSRVGGQPPFWIQWFFNGSRSIAGATNSTLELRHIQPVQAGDYRIAVTNPFGAVTSAPAKLSLIAPMKRNVAGAALLTNSSQLYPSTPAIGRRPRPPQAEE